MRTRRRHSKDAASRLSGSRPGTLVRLLSCTRLRSRRHRLRDRVRAADHARAPVRSDRPSVARRDATLVQPARRSGVGQLRSRRAPLSCHRVGAASVSVKGATGGRADAAERRRDRQRVLLPSSTPRGRRRPRTCRHPLQRSRCARLHPRRAIRPLPARSRPQAAASTERHLVELHPLGRVGDPTRSWTPSRYGIRFTYGTSELGRWPHTSTRVGFACKLAVRADSVRRRRPVR